MRTHVLALLFLASLATPTLANNHVVVTVNRANQTLSVEEGGREVYLWKVSTGRRLIWTPAGHFRPYWLDATHRSHKYGNEPMPHSIFFHRNVAIHGTPDRVAELGRQASHGCVRLHPANARILFGLVQSVGMSNTAIIVR